MAVDTRPDPLGDVEQQETRCTPTREASSWSPSDNGEILRDRGGKRIYSDQERASAMAVVDVCGGNTRKAGAILGISSKTLDEWKTTGRRAELGVVRQMQAQTRQVLANELLELAQEGLRHAHRVLPDATFQQAMVGTGIALTHAAVLDNRPSSIVRHEHVAIEGAVESVFALLGDTTIDAEFTVEGPADAADEH